MNKTYRIMWSAVRQAFVVTSEACRSHGKPASSPRLAAALSLGLLAASHSALAQACPSSADGSPLKLVSRQCQGDIVNAGHIQSEQEGIEISQAGANPDLDGDGRVDEDFLSKSQVRGDVINAGKVESKYEALTISDNIIHGGVRNDGELISQKNEGIEVIGAQVQGAIENNGLIRSLSDDAIYIRGADDMETRVDGGISNRGRLEAADGKGLRIRNAVIGAGIRNEADGVIVSFGDSIRLGDGTVLNGDLVNRGSLQSQDGDGMEVMDSTVNGGARNDGEIKAREDGMFIEASTLQRVENHGTIDAGSGMSLGEKTLLIEGVYNTGAIRGEDSAIRMRGAQVGHGLFNSGSLQGGRYAILATDYVRDDGTVLANRLENIVFDTRADDVVSGDILAAGSALTLASGATLQQRNAIKVKQLNIEAGATLQANAGASLAQEPDLIGDGIQTGQLRNAGALAIAAGEQAALHGDYLQTASGELRVGVADDSRYGKLKVTGKAELPSQARIAVDVTDPSFRFSARALQGVLQAGELVSDGSFAVSDNSLLFDFGARKNGNDVDLTLQASSRVASSVRQQARYYALPAAQALDAALRSQPQGELASHWVKLGSEQQVADAVSQTLPLLLGQGQAVAVRTLTSINQALHSRWQAATPAGTGHYAWIKPFGSLARQQDRDGMAGFKLHGSGFVLGADGVLGTSRLGVALAYANTNVNSLPGAVSQSLDMDAYQLMAYGQRPLGANTELNFQVDLGQNHNQSSRSLPFAQRKADANYRGYSSHVGLGLEHQLVWGHSRLTPALRVDYTRVRDAAYQEQGAGALNLDVAARHGAELVFAADAKLSHALSSKLTLSAKLGAAYDSLNQTASIRAAYIGAPGEAFTTYGMTQNPWSLRSGLGLNYLAENGLETSAHYDVESRSGFLSQGAALKLSYRF